MSDIVAEPLTDLRRRAKEAVAIADGQALPTWQRVLRSLQAFSGTQLTGLPPKINRAVEKHFVAVNRILGKYEPEKEEDYERMSETDLQEILDVVKDLATKITPVK